MGRETWWRLRIVLLAAAMVVAPPRAPAADAVDAFRRTMRALEAKDREAARDFRKEERRAIDAWHRPLREQYFNKVTEPLYDLEAIRAFYEGFADRERERGEAIGLLAASGHGDALKLLWSELLAWADAADSLDADFDDVAGDTGVAAMEQEPGVRRYALSFREAALRRALPGLPGAAAFLATKGFEEATKRDRARRVTTRRVLVTDLLSGSEAPEARALLARLLEDDEVPLRIAALEALIGAGAPAREALVPLLRDGAPPVRFALLDAIRGRTADDPRWVPPLVDAFARSEGRFRVDLHDHLVERTGVDRGDDAAAWAAWATSVRASLEDGSYRRPGKPDGGEGDSAVASPPSPGPRFHGIEVRSRRVLFLCDGWTDLLAPADHEFQRTKHLHDWISGTREWKRDRESHQDVLARILPPCIEAMEEGSTVQVILAGNASNAIGQMTPMEPRGPVPADARTAARAKAFLEGFKVGSTQCFHTALRDALRSTDHDTIVLYGSGTLARSRLVHEAAVLEEARRLQRFRRHRIHAVRITHVGPECERIMKALAAESGGRYLWADRAPAK